MTKSEEIQAKEARYKKVEKVADKFGRLIGVRRLKPSEQLKIEEMAPNLEGDRKVYDQEGKEIAVSRRAPLALAASVCMIDDIPVMFPRRREELDAILDRLDNEGIEAVIEGLGKLGEIDLDASKDPIAEAKNSAGTSLPE